VVPSPGEYSRRLIIAALECSVNGQIPLVRLDKISSALNSADKDSSYATSRKHVFDAQATTNRWAALNTT